MKLSKSKEVVKEKIEDSIFIIYADRSDFEEVKKELETIASKFKIRLDCSY